MVRLAMTVWAVALGVLGGALMAAPASPPVRKPASRPMAAAVSPAATPVAASPTSDSTKTVQKLPAAAADAFVAGNGRFIVLRLAKLQKLALFDTHEQKIARYIALPHDDALVAAGATKMFIGSPAAHTLERWDLFSGEKELAVAAGDAPISSLLMGWASTQPVLVNLTDTIDPETLRLRPLQPASPGNRNSAPGEHYFASAAGDGSAFAAWRDGGSPLGFYLLIIRGARSEWRYDHTTVGSIQPSMDASVIFTGAGVFSPTLKQLTGSRNDGVRPLPVYGPDYYVIAQTSKEVRGQPKEPMQFSLCAIDRLKPIAALPELSEFADRPENPNAPRPTPYLRRFFLIPSAGVLVTLPETMDAMIVRPFSLEATLDRAGIDYLFVTAAPPRAATRGGLYTHQFTAASSHAPVRYHLDSGPPGMTLGAAGELRWPVPADAGEHAVTVIVTLEDAGKQQTPYAFSVSLR